jgi:hypothetical protein
MISKCAEKETKSEQQNNKFMYLGNKDLGPCFSCACIDLSTNRDGAVNFSTNKSAPLQGIFPGTFLPSLGMVLVAWGGETHEKHEYQVQSLAIVRGKSAFTFHTSVIKRYRRQTQTILKGEKQNLPKTDCSLGLHSQIFLRF